MNKIMEEIQKLSIEEQMQIAYAIWENADFDDDEMALSPAQKTMLNQRLEAARLAPEEGLTWDQMRANIQKKKK